MVQDLGDDCDHNAYREAGKRVVKKRASRIPGEGIRNLVDSHDIPKSAVIVYGLGKSARTTPKWIR